MSNVFLRGACHLIRLRSLFLFLSLVDTHIMLPLSRPATTHFRTHDRLSDPRHVLPYTDFILCLAQFTSCSEDALPCFIKTLVHHLRSRSFLFSISFFDVLWLFFSDSF